uniref:Uncharacterized protein n=1 Tax=Rhizophora mucronata TaxID=61149 RepID=A0A2P2R2L6_RHIMU
MQWKKHAYEVLTERNMTTENLLELLHEENN